MSYIEENLGDINISKEIKNDLENNVELVKLNLEFLKNLGIINYQNIFKTYYPMFLMDNSNFQEIFNKYDINDLIDKLDRNVAIIEHL